MLSPEAANVPCGLPKTATERCPLRETEHAADGIWNTMWEFDGALGDVSQSEWARAQKCSFGFWAGIHVWWVLWRCFFERKTTNSYSSKMPLRKRAFCYHKLTLPVIIETRSRRGELATGLLRELQGPFAGDAWASCGRCMGLLREMQPMASGIQCGSLVGP